MKFVRTLFKVSYSEIFLFLLSILLLTNVPVFIFTLIKGNPSLFLNDASWIMQLLFPLAYSLIFTAVNRRGVLKVSAFDDQKTINQKIKSVLLKKGFIATDATKANQKYIRKTKLDRLLNAILNQDIDIKITDNEVFIFARKNMLDSIKMKLKFNTI
ncbi:hypothetical protein SAMN06265379_101316 [Saccharicrinis carchari]|uniref:Uncharacterized protein n=1 Tax=Saccharicrinis carchari TaxID=1168039 RepID=A0A521APX7_SACCC|nr:hypothetical protein [Saccharicrinis carchari]SMO36845.1 hypothetical protein SAMN06265379_101316 [Saccharicrinis carchari]